MVTDNGVVLYGSSKNGPYISYDCIEDIDKTYNNLKKDGWADMNSEDIKEIII